MLIKLHSSISISTLYLQVPVLYLTWALLQLNHFNLLIFLKLMFVMLSLAASLDPNKALGIDGIGPKILKNCSEFLSLCHLFNLYLASSVIQNAWKTHQIIPIFKSDRSLISNYRPISLLCNVSKVLEHIIFNKIINHVTALISPCQFGFQRARSTTQQLIMFRNDIQNAVSKGYQIDVIYPDFKKGFDSVPHSNFLIKLWPFGIPKPLGMV